MRRGNEVKGKSRCPKDKRQDSRESCQTRISSRATRLREGAIMKAEEKELWKNLSHRDLEKQSYQYTPCFGTHGNQGKIARECPLCHNPLYEKEQDGIRN